MRTGFTATTPAELPEFMVYPLADTKLFVGSNALGTIFVAVIIGLVTKMVDEMSGKGKGGLVAALRSCSARPPRASAARS